MFAILCWALANSVSFAQTPVANLPGGLQMSAVVDLLGQGALGPSSTAAKRFDMREAEISFFSPADTWWNGTLSSAAHLESGELNFEVHEAFLGSSKLIPRVRGRVGLFFLGVGRLNSFHRHDWPFPTAPRVHSTFFDAEGAADTGAELSWLLPLPFYLDFTAGMTNGWNWGHAHSVGTAPAFPTHYTRLATSFEVPGGGTSLVGINYVGRVSSTQSGQYLFGIDGTFKWREGKTLLFLLQTEGWWRALRPLAGTGTAEDDFGLYIFPQVGLSSAWKVGVRLDSYAVVNIGGVAPIYAVVPVVSWEPSEFTRFRTAFTQEWPTGDRMIELQVSFILGAHPAHDF